MMTQRAIKLAGWILAITVTCGVTPAKAAPIRVVILSGQNNHDWKATTPLLEKIYADSGRFTFETVNDVTTITPATFAKCDVIVSNWTCHPVMTGGPWTPEGKQAFGDAIRSGKGFVQFHAACAACNDWEDFQEISGVTWKLNTTSHTAYHTFKVVVNDSKHPITKGMSDFWITDELYEKMAKMGKSEFHTLASAFADPFYGGTTAWEPMLITTQLGKGRGVNFLLGHDVPVMRNIAWQTIMLRCTEWAATGKATIPIPQDWPTTAAAAVTIGVNVDAALKTAATYAFGQGNAPIAPVEQLVICATSRTGKTDVADRAKLAAKLAETIPACKTSEAKAFFCKQLAMIGTAAEVLAVAPLLADEQAAMMARLALERIPGPESAKALRDAATSLTGNLKIGAINSIGTKADPDAVAMLTPLAKDADSQVATAAIAALGKIGTSEAAKALRIVRENTAEATRPAVTDALLNCAERLLAGGNKQAATSIYKMLYGPAEPTRARAAALNGLVVTQGYSAASLVIDALIGQERQMAGMAAQLISQEKRLDANRLLANLRGDLKSNRTETRNRAIRAISAWPTAAPFDDLLALTDEKLDEKQRNLVAQGIVRSIGSLHDRSPELATELIAKALKTAAPVEMKKSLLDKLSLYPSPAAMQLGQTYIKDAELAEDACVAVLRIASALPIANKSEVVPAMQRVIAACKSPDIVRKADILLRKISKPVNLTIGAKAGSPDGLEPDGGSGNDNAAIDGNPDTYWDETDNQKLYRFKVSFSQPREMSAINIKGHAYRSHSPKDFDILCDDKVVKTISDAEYDPSTNEFYVDFPKTTCTSLELKITGYYGISPGIRELEIYNVSATALPTKAPPLPKTPKFSWRQQDDSVALFNYDRVVWQLNYSKNLPKSCFYPLCLVDGTALTWLSPPDHPWHRSLWFSWKEINGLNYWEEDPATGVSAGKTEVVGAKTDLGKDFSARIEIRLSYHPKDQPAPLTETRVLQVSAPDKDGHYDIDWQSTFTAGEQDVALKGGTAGGGYAGLTVRFANTTRQWQMLDSEGRQDTPSGGVTKNIHGQQARWVDFSLVDTATGQPAGIAILDHPANLRHPSLWHAVMDDKIPFGCFSPSPLWKEPYTLAAGQSMTLRYKILVHPGRPDRDAIEHAWKTLSGNAK